jgi:hypothetical protein
MRSKDEDDSHSQMMTCSANTFEYPFGITKMCLSFGCPTVNECVHSLFVSKIPHLYIPETAYYLEF